MEITKAEHVSYGYTVKDNRPETTDYQSFFDRCEKFGVKITHKYPEYDSKGKLHIHGIMQIPKGFYRKKICMDGLHIKLVEIYDEAGWKRYITKDQPKKVQKPLFVKTNIETQLEDAKPIQDEPDTPIDIDVKNLKRLF